MFALYGYDGVSGCCGGRSYNPMGKAALGDCGCGCNGSLCDKVKQYAPYAAVVVGLALFLGILK